LHDEWEICYDSKYMLHERETGKGKVLSAGYPAVEDLIENEDFDHINAVFEKAYQELETLTRQKGGFKATKEAKKAMKSIEIVMDLLKELLAIKYQIQALGENAKKS
jgi:transposase-like protein